MTAAMKDAAKAVRKQIVDEIVSVAEDMAGGRLQPAQLDAVLLSRCRELVGTVVGPDSALWPVQQEICRGVLSFNGIPVDEQAEWLAVNRTAQGIEAVPAEPSWIEQALAQMADDDDEQGESAD